jgi:hypothetical protein
MQKPLSYQKGEFVQLLNTHGFYVTERIIKSYIYSRTINICFYRTSYHYEAAAL